MPLCTWSFTWVKWRAFSCSSDIIIATYSNNSNIDSNRNSDNNNKNNNSLVMAIVLLIVIVILIMPFSMDARSSDRVNKLPNRKINYHWMRKKHSFPRKILSLFFSIAYLNCWFWKRHRLDKFGIWTLIFIDVQQLVRHELNKKFAGDMKTNNYCTTYVFFLLNSPYSKFSFPEDEPFRRTMLTIKIHKRVDKLFGVILP